MSGGTTTVLHADRQTVTPNTTTIEFSFKWSDATAIGATDGKNGWYILALDLSTFDTDGTFAIAAGTQGADYNTLSVDGVPLTYGEDFENKELEFKPKKPLGLTSDSVISGTMTIVGVSAFVGGSTQPLESADVETMLWTQFPLI